MVMIIQTVSVSIFTSRIFIGSNRSNANHDLNYHMNNESSQCNITVDSIHNATSEMHHVLTVLQKQANMNSTFIQNKLSDKNSSSITNSSSNSLYMVISFVNGIYHSEDEVNELSEYIKQQFQGEVRPFYNPSSGSWVRDATKAGTLTRWIACYMIYNFEIHCLLVSYFGIRLRVDISTKRLTPRQTISGASTQHSTGPTTQR